MKIIMSLACGLWVALLVVFFKKCGADINGLSEFIFVFIGILLFNHITRKDIKHEK